jgi:hypothetical protein
LCDSGGWKHAHKCLPRSALGMVMFGWSTALLFFIIQRADRESRA